MIVTSIKKVMLIVLLALGTLSVAFAQVGFDNSEGNLKKIGRIDHQKQILVISDQEYKMPLNFKVYIATATGKLRSTNRYALKVGQSVYINAERKSKVSYVNELLIMNY